MYTRFDPAKLADVQMVADKLADLPKDALLYISGYVEGRCDAAEQNFHVETKQFAIKPGT